MRAKRKTSKIITWFAGVAILAVTLIIPIGYFIISYQYAKGSLEAEADITARSITRIINSNPEMWEFEQLRLKEFLEHRPCKRYAEMRRVLNAKGEIVVESGEKLAAPVVVSSDELRDAGLVVGRMEIHRSLRPLVVKTGLLFLLIGPIGLSAFLALRILPIRTLYQAEEALRASEEKYRALVDNLPVGVYKTHVNGDYIFINRAFAKILEFGSSEELMNDGSVLIRYKNPNDRYALIEKLKQRGMVENYEIQMLTKTGHLKEVLLNAKLEGEIISGMLMDITERKQLEQELKRIAVTDRLTGAYNRTKFEEIIRREMERAIRYGHPLSLAVVDIDHFKEVNDQHGHLAGDHVLKTVADIVRECIRGADSLVRWGGEEFIIVIPETDLQGAEAFCERVRTKVAVHCCEGIGPVTVSLGITQFRQDDTEDTFIMRADDAMYRAKAKGRDRVEVDG